MLLADSTILQFLKEGRLGIEGFDPSLLGPCSVDLTLSTQFWRAKKKSDRPTRIYADGTPHHMLTEEFEADSVIMVPNSFVLARTEQRVTLPNDLAGHLEGRSRLARLGIIVHGTAGLFHPGWSGYPILELANLGPYDVTIEAGKRICSMTFQITDETCKGYSGRYQNQKGA